MDCICDPLNENLHSLHNFWLFTVFKEWVFKISAESGQLIHSFEVIALGSQASKKIDLYSNHTENK